MFCTWSCTVAPRLSYCLLETTDHVEASCKAANCTVSATPSQAPHAAERHDSCPGVLWVGPHSMFEAQASLQRGAASAAPSSLGKQLCVRCNSARRYA